MAVYFETTVVKNDLDIASTDFDTQIADWGLKSDAEVDDLLYISAEKARRITALPVLPLATAPETIKRAANSLVKAKFYEFNKNPELVAMHKKEALETIDNYILRLETDQRVYSRIAR